MGDLIRLHTKLIYFGMACGIEPNEISLGSTSQHKYSMHSDSNIQSLGLLPPLLRRTRTRMSFSLGKDTSQVIPKLQIQHQKDDDNIMERELPMQSGLPSGTEQTIICVKSDLEYSPQGNQVGLLGHIWFGSYTL